MVVGLGLATAWTLGLFQFARSIPNHVKDTDTRTQAIVVLTGGSGRLGAGLDLLSDQRAGMVFVSGVYEGVDVRQLLALSQESPEDLACCVETGHGAANTAGNAHETAEWMHRQGFDSLRLVTSAYHMPRSLLEFHHALPDATVIPHPVFADAVKQDGWWKWPGTAALIIGEYNKFLLAWMGHVFLDLFAGRSEGAA